MYKLVIFDLDGTLLNTIGDLASACNIALAKCNFPTHTTDEYYGFVGNGIMKLLERSLPPTERNPETLALIREFFIKEYSLNNCVNTKPYNGIPELLSQLRNANICIAVASNKYQKAVEDIIHAYFGNIDFVAVLGQRDGIPIKPNPHIIYEIMDIANTQPQETLYVGDSGVDANTAASIPGLSYIGVTWGFRNREEAALYGTKNFVDTPEEIWRFCCK